jgi:short-subunit dehydrogenase
MYQVVSVGTSNNLDIFINNRKNARSTPKILAIDLTPCVLGFALLYPTYRTLYQQIQAAGKPVEAIAINAGVGVGGAFVETDLQEELNIIELNIASTVHLAKRVVPDMVARHKGRVLFTSSIASQMPGPFQAVLLLTRCGTVQ